MELTLLHRAEQAERATAADEFRIISEAALAIFGWQDERYKRVLKLLEAGASLDAAMTLVPEGCKPMLDGHWNIASVHRYWSPLNGEDAGHEDFSGEGASLALALCAAALRARAAESSK